MAYSFRAVGTFVSPFALGLLMATGGTTAFSHDKAGQNDGMLYSVKQTADEERSFQGDEGAEPTSTGLEFRAQESDTSGQVNSTQNADQESTKDKATARVKARSVMQQQGLAQGQQSREQETNSDVLRRGQLATRVGSNRNLGHSNSSNGIHGLIHTNRHIIYDRDPLEISVRFPRGARLITSGEADAYLLIFQPDTETIAVPINADVSENQRPLFRVDSIDVQELPPGVYQLGLVITVPGGDPLFVRDWYNGLRGLLAVRGITVSGSVLEIDRDGDGMIDRDEEGDGFADEELDEQQDEDEEFSDDEEMDDEPTEEESDEEMEEESSEL